MFIAFVTGPPPDSHENLPSEMVLDLRSNTLEDAKNELYAMFGLMPGQQGYYRPNELGRARLCEIANDVTLTESDISVQREEAARLEAEAYAEAEARREMEQFERSKKKQKHRR